VDDAGVDVDEDGLDDDMSLADALRPSNRSGSSFPLEGLAGNSNSNFNYSGNLRSEPKGCTVPRLFKAVMNTIVTDEPFRQDARERHAKCAFGFRRTCFCLNLLLLVRLGLDT